MANLKNPYAGKPYTSASPGVDAARSPVGATKLPAPPRGTGQGSSTMGRLASALASLPKGVGVSNGNNKSKLFLP